MQWTTMKHVGAIASLGALACALTATPLDAQRNETLLNSRGGTTFGGFGGPVVKLTRVAGEDVVMSGGRGGVIINRQLVIGGGGYSLTSENVRTGYEFSNGDPASLRLDYGGLEFEYIVRPRSLVHVTFYTLLGGGMASYQSTRDQGGATSTQRLESNVFVLEPMVNVELNVTRWFRTGLGAGYRYVDGSELPGASDSGLSSGVATITFKFGSF